VSIDENFKFYLIFLRKTKIVMRRVICHCYCHCHL